MHRIAVTEPNVTTNHYLLAAVIVLGVGGCSNDVEPEPLYTSHLELSFLVDSAQTTPVYGLRWTVALDETPTSPSLGFDGGVGGGFYGRDPESWAGSGLDAGRIALVGPAGSYGVTVTSWLITRVDGAGEPMYGDDICEYPYDAACSFCAPPPSVCHPGPTTNDKVATEHLVVELSKNSYRVGPLSIVIK